MRRRNADITREPPWMCVRCGYVMTAASPADPDHHEPPEEGSLSVCFNCANPYIREGGRWRAMTGKDWDGLVPEERRELLMAIRQLRRSAGARDLRRDEKAGRA
jgi:hypothetical protein